MNGIEKEIALCQNHKIRQLARRLFVKYLQYKTERYTCRHLLLLKIQPFHRCGICKFDQDFGLFLVETGYLKE